MLSRLSGAVKRLVGKIQKVEHVGTDRSGNKYFKRPDEIDGTVVEKRWIEFQGDKLPDPTTVPVEWTSWLAGTRPHAPSEEEMSALEMRRTMIKFRASVLEKEEEKRKFRARSLRQAGVMEQEGPHEMSRVMEHIAASSLRDKDLDSPESTSMPTLAKQRPGSRVGVQTFDPRAESDSSKPPSFQPNSWEPGETSGKSEENADVQNTFRPASRESSFNSSSTIRDDRGSTKGASKGAGPAGRGAKFQPGSWQPG